MTFALVPSRDHLRDMIVKTDGSLQLNLESKHLFII